MKLKCYVWFTATFIDLNRLKKSGKPGSHGRMFNFGSQKIVSLIESNGMCWVQWITANYIVDWQLCNSCLNTQYLIVSSGQGNRPSCKWMHVLTQRQEEAAVKYKCPLCSVSMPCSRVFLDGSVSVGGKATFPVIAADMTTQCGIGMGIDTVLLIPMSLSILLNIIDCWSLFVDLSNL